LIIFLNLTILSHFFVFLPTAEKTDFSFQAMEWGEVYVRFVTLGVAPFKGINPGINPYINPGVKNEKFPYKLVSDN